MGIVLSLLLIAIGAVLKFAVSASVAGFDLQAAGVILMIVGAIGVVVSVIAWSSWGGFGVRRQTVVDSTVPQGEPIIRTEREIR